MTEGFDNLPYSNHVNRYSFGTRDRIVIDGIDYIPQSADHYGHVLLRLGSGLPEAFTHARICDLVSAGVLEVHPDWYSAHEAQLRCRHGHLRLSDLPPAAQRQVDWRRQHCDRFLILERTEKDVTRSEPSMKRTIGRITADIAASKVTADGRKVRCDSKEQHPANPPPSPSQLRRWLRRYEDGGYQPLILLDGRHRSGNRSVRGDDDSVEFRHEFARRYASSNKPSKAMVYKEYEDALDEANELRAERGAPLLVKVSRKSFCRLIDRLDPILVYAGRHGVEAARLKFAYVQTGLDVTRALERVEMDEWKVTLQVLLIDAGVWATLSPEARAVVKRSRLWLSVAMDCATRCCLAARLLDKAPSSESAIATLEMALFDKSKLAAAAGAKTPYDMHGTPESLSTDTGAAFVSAEYRSAATDVGIKAHLPPVKLPFLRATVERFFGTVRTSLMAHFPGQTFENLIAKGKYNAEENACLDIAELNRVIIRWICDIYHNTPHEGLAGETPRNAWRRLNGLYGVALPPSQKTRRSVFGITGRRPIGIHGIWALGLHYQSAELQQYRNKMKQKPVRFRLDRFDLGTMEVWMETHWITVPAAFQEIAGTSYWEWTECVRELRLRNANIAALSRRNVRDALNDIRATAEMAIKQAEIGAHIISGADFAKVERDLFRTFAFAGDGTVSDDDLLGWEGAATEAVSPPEISLSTHVVSRGDWLTED